jgi:hypothetical protein
LQAFRDAHAAVLRSGATLPAEGPQPAIYWNGIPCVEDGSIVWAIAVGEGDAARERALDLQKAIEDVTGHRIPAGRVLPRRGRRGPHLVWVVAGDVTPEGWPNEVREAASKAPQDGLVPVETEDGSYVVIVGRRVPAERLAGAFRARPALYALSRQVR